MSPPPGGDPDGLASRLYARRREAAVALALLIGFFVLYYLVAESYRQLPGYGEYRNTFFGADHNEALSGWLANHKGSHPLVLLIVVPLGDMLAAVTGTYEDGMVVYAAGVGALTVALFFLTARVFCGSTGQAAAVAAFFGCSMSQLVFGAIPDTYVLSALLLLPSYLLAHWCLRRGRTPLPAWVAAGVAAFAVTITNFMHAALLLLVTLMRAGGGRRLATYAAFLGLVAVLVLALAHVQKAIYPEARLFFMPQTFEHESQYMSSLVREEPVRLAAELARNVFLYPFVGQFPRVTRFEPGERLKMVYYRAPVNFSAVGWLAAALWGVLLARGVFLGLRSRESRVLGIGIALVVAGNVVLHAIYGPREIFLYSPHFAFAVLLLSQSPRAAHGTGVLAAWSLLAGLTAANNLHVVWQILEAFAD